MASEILNDDPVLTLEELCENCGLPAAKVTAYVEEGLIEVRGEVVTEWRFSEASIVQIGKAHRLEQDLRLNPAGATLVLELIARIEALKAQIRRLEKSSP